MDQNHHRTCVLCDTNVLAGHQASPKICWFQSIILEYLLPPNSRKKYYVTLRLRRNFKRNRKSDLIYFVKMFWMYSRVLCSQRQFILMQTLSPSVQHPVKAKQADILVFAWFECWWSSEGLSNNGFLYPDLLPMHLQVHHLPPPGGLWSTWRGNIKFVNFFRRLCRNSLIVGTR